MYHAITSMYLIRIGNHVHNGVFTICNKTQIQDLDIWI